MARVRLDPEARRAQLVAIAYRLLEERGLDSVSVEDVADAAGVSRSLVYAYFGDRDGLVAEVYLAVEGNLRRRALRGAVRCPGGRQPGSLLLLRGR